MHGTLAPNQKLKQKLEPINMDVLCSIKINKKQHNRQVVCLRKWKCKRVSKKDREDGSMSP